MSPPVPAFPVKKTFWPCLTSCSTCACMYLSLNTAYALHFAALHSNSPQLRAELGAVCSVIAQPWATRGRPYLFLAENSTLSFIKRQVLSSIRVQAGSLVLHMCVADVRCILCSDAPRGWRQALPLDRLAWLQFVKSTLQARIEVIVLELLGEEGFIWGRLNL